MTDQDQAQEQRQFAIQRIYVKDVSFEAPAAPDVFRQEWRPDNSLNLNTEAQALDPQTYEVVLTLTLTAKIGESTAYLAEVKQAGIFTLAGFSDQEKAPMLAAYCPNVLFAYAREVISDLVTKGSFPQMVLQPVNFDALFVQHQQELARRAQSTDGRADKALN
jgi:preprotein translocase subunit SecB